MKPDESAGPWSPAWGAEPEVVRYSDGIYVYYNGPLPKQVKVGRRHSVLLQEPGLRRIWGQRFRRTLTLYVNCTHWQR